MKSFRLTHQIYMLLIFSFQINFDYNNVNNVKDNVLIEIKCFIRDKMWQPRVNLAIV